MGRKSTVKIASRPEKRGPPGPSPLLVIAGLPKETAEAAAATVTNDRQTRWRAVATAFTAKKDIYAHAASLLELGRLACEFAFAGNVDSDGIPTPSRVAVAYVEGQGSEKLWEVFGHAAWPIPLRHPDWRYETGQHWRSEIEIVNRVVSLALKDVENGVAETIRLRLEAHRADDALLLPGRNFQITAQERLVDRFEAFMSGTTDVQGVEADIQAKKFAYEKLAPFYDRTGGRNKRLAFDRRDIVFAKSNNGQDGGQHQIPKGAEVTPPTLRTALEARFRFGTPLVPAGFQHDAQFENGKTFVSEPFFCVTKGEVNMEGDHVNVFPSDVVTGKRSAKK